MEELAPQAESFGLNLFRGMCVGVAWGMGTGMWGDGDWLVPKYNWRIMLPPAKSTHTHTHTTQLAIPVLFIGLLVWIKSICTKIDAPSVAYACGQTAGFEGYYTESLRDYVRNLSGVPLLQCLQPPEGWCVRAAGARCVCIQGI